LDPDATEEEIEIAGRKMVDAQKKWDKGQWKIDEARRRERDLEDKKGGRLQSEIGAWQ